jgi:hypothetical protein
MGQRCHIIGQGDGVSRCLFGIAQPLRHLGVFPPLATLMLALLAGELLDRLHGVVGPVFQVADQWSHLVAAVEDVAMTGHARQGFLLSGAQSPGGIRDGAVGLQAALDAFQQAHGPGVAVAVLLKTQKIAIS